MKHVLLLLGIARFLSLVQATALHCSEYLKCEAEMMTLHHRCSERSRNITGESCNLVDEFRELRNLMSVRETEFAICVGHESIRAVSVNPHIPSFKCNTTITEPSVIQGCWRSVVVLKRRCQRLKRCCPAADRCMKMLSSSDTTALVRRKYDEINRATLECRNEMEKMVKLDGHVEANLTMIRTSAAISAQSEALMDVTGPESEERKTKMRSFEKQKQFKSRAKNITSILKSRYSELKRIAEELAEILARKRQLRREKQLLKKYGSGFTSGKKHLLHLHSVKEAMVEADKSQQLLSSAQDGIDQLELFTSTAAAQKSRISNTSSDATVTSPVETPATTSTTTPSTTTSAVWTTTKRSKQFYGKRTSNRQERPKARLEPLSNNVPIVDIQTRTTIAPKVKLRKLLPAANPVYLAPAPIPGLTANRMAESKSIELISTKSPAELQEYLRKQKGELPKTTNLPAEAYVGDDGTWTVDPPQEENSKTFSGNNNDLIVTHEEGTFPVSPYHGELMGDHENEIRRSGKHSFSKRRYSRIKLKKMVEQMPTAEPLFIKNEEPSPQDLQVDRTTPHIVDEELVDARKSSALRIPFSLVDNSLQNRIGIFPITTKEPRRIKITMWPPGYRNHFTKRPFSEVQLQTSTPVPERVESETLLTSRMPDSFYKVFYPQLKPAKRHRLKGYRNKVLFARRHLKRPKDRGAFNHSNAMSHHTMDTPNTVTKLPIHRLRPTQLDDRLNPRSNEFLQGRPNDVVVDAAAQVPSTSSAFITPQPSSSNHNSSLEDSNIDDLKFQLMIELERYIQSQHGKLREEMESELRDERRSFLRKTRVNNGRIGYCELYAACSDELRTVEQQCKKNNSRIMPGLPKQRFGDCSTELAPEFKKYDELTLQADDVFKQCFSKKLEDKTHEDLTLSMEDCPSDWPLLPTFEDKSTCHEQIRIVKNHCEKLGRCCSTVNRCRERVENVAIEGMVSEIKTIIALKTAECQIKNFKEYRRKRLHKSHQLRQHNNDKITDKDLSFLQSAQPDEPQKPT